METMGFSCDFFVGGMGEPLRYDTEPCGCEDSGKKGISCGDK